MTAVEADANAQFERLLVEALERYPFAYMRLSELLLHVWEGCLTPVQHGSVSFNWKQAQNIPVHFRPTCANAVLMPGRIGRDLVRELAAWVRERPRFQMVECWYVAPLMSLNLRCHMCGASPLLYTLCLRS
jgi:hypothetical protein